MDGMAGEERGFQRQEQNQEKGKKEGYQQRDTCWGEEHSGDQWMFNPIEN